MLWSTVSKAADKSSRTTAQRPQNPLPPDDQTGHAEQVISDNQEPIYRIILLTPAYTY